MKIEEIERREERDKIIYCDCVTVIYTGFPSVFFVIFFRNSRFNSELGIPRFNGLRK